MLLKFIEMSDTREQALGCINAVVRREKENFSEVQILFAYKGNWAPLPPSDRKPMEGSLAIWGLERLLISPQQVVAPKTRTLPHEIINRPLCFGGSGDQGSPMI